MNHSMTAVIPLRLTLSYALTACIREAVREEEADQPVAHDRHVTGLYLLEYSPDIQCRIVDDASGSLSLRPLPLVEVAGCRTGDPG